MFALSYCNHVTYGPGCSVEYTQQQRSTQTGTIDEAEVYVLVYTPLVYTWQNIVEFCGCIGG